MNNEFNIQSFVKILSKYKWLVISSTLVSLFSMAIYLFFTPVTYMTHAIMEVKIPQEKRSTSDDPLQNLFHATSLKVEKEIEILKTFNINKDVISSINLQTQFFIYDKYKYLELYKKNIPLKIDYSDIDKELVNKMIKLTPLKDNHFKLEVQYPLSEKLLNMVKNKKLFQFNQEEIFQFGIPLKINSMKINIEKNSDITDPIYIKFTGSTRTIYEKIINKNLNIKQLNIHAPLIEISYADTVSERATEYINQLLQTFQEKNINNKILVNNNILNFIQEQVDKTQKKFSISEKSLEHYKSNKQLINPTLQSNINIEQLSKIELKIFDNNLKKRLINNILKTLEQGGEVSTIAPALVELKDESTLSLIEMLNKLELKENQLSQEYTSEFPELRKVQIDIENIHRKIYSNIKSLKSSIYNQANNLVRIKKSFEKTLSSLPKEETKLVNLNRNHDVYSKMLAYLLEKKAENNMLKIANISDYKIIEKAYTPSLPFKPRKNLLLLLSLILGLFGGFLIAFFHHKFHKKIISDEDISISDKLNIYGKLPLLKQINKHPEVFKNTNSLYSTCMRKIRRDLELLYPTRKSKVVLTTSIEKNLGKSMTVANLGAILQLAKFKTIVVDFNLQNPTLHNYFNINAKQGLTEYLNDTNQNLALYNIVKSTGFNNLDILPAGTLSHNPTELLLSYKVKELLFQLKRTYDYIIIDCASIQEVPETVNIMKQSDINLILLRAKISERNSTVEAERIIKKYNINNAGFILNEFELTDNCI